MTHDKKYACPRCEYPLVPVHAIEGSKRRIIALTCPEPYCDHMEMIPRAKARDIARGLSRPQEASSEAVSETPELRRAVN